MFEEKLAVRTLAGPENKLAANLASLIASSRLIEFGVSGFCFSFLLGCKKLAAGGGFGLGVSGFYLGYKKLATRLGLGVGVGVCSGFGVASRARVCMRETDERTISKKIGRLALNWPKFGGIFSYGVVKMPILWGFALLRIQEGAEEGSQVRASKHTPTPLGRPRDTHIVPPLPHAIFYPKANLVGTLKAFR